MVQGYAERKLLLINDVTQVCKKIHNDEIRKERLAALKNRSQVKKQDRYIQRGSKTQLTCCSYLKQQLARSIATITQRNCISLSCIEMHSDDYEP